MKKCLLIVIAALGLTGCSTNNVPGKTNGWIDCYSITVQNGGNTIFNQTYQVASSEVWEYKNDKGESLFVDSRPQYTDYDNTKVDCTIAAYPSRYESIYVEYTFSRFVGYLTMERNYYLDLSGRTIDSETKWMKYKGDKDSAPYPEVGMANNEEAYACAKKNYYQLGGFYAQSVYLSLDSNLSSLERHTYTQVGSDSVITYTAKWF